MCIAKQHQEKRGVGKVDNSEFHVKLSLWLRVSRLLLQLTVAPRLGS